jgi:nucleotide-binding universal stress UspA family protein
MKILLAVDGSAESQEAVEQVINRPWPAGSEVKVISVAFALPYFPDPIFFGAAMHFESLKLEEERAPRDVEKAVQEIRQKASSLQVTSEVKEGSAKECVIEEAETWGADLIILGSRGHGGVKRFLLGSVAHGVVLHAPCSVEVVRSRHAES